MELRALAKISEFSLSKYRQKLNLIPTELSCFRLLVNFFVQLMAYQQIIPKNILRRMKRVYYNTVFVAYKNKLLIIQ